MPDSTSTPQPIRLPPPTKHQLALMIWVAVFPTLTVLNLLLGGSLTGLPVVLRTFVLATIAVPIVIYGVMPRLHRVRARLTARLHPEVGTTRGAATAEGAIPPTAGGRRLVGLLTARRWRIRGNATSGATPTARAGSPHSTAAGPEPPQGGPQHRPDPVGIRRTPRAQRPLRAPHLTPERRHVGTSG